MPGKRKAFSPKDNSANLGFEARLWDSANKLRNNMDAAEPSGASQHAPQGSTMGQRGSAELYKHVVLGLMFVELESRTEGETSSYRLPTARAKRPNDTDFHNGNRARISFQNFTYLN